MAIRKPTNVASLTSTATTTESQYVNIPSDASQVTFKLWCAASNDGTTDVSIWTTDDGGTTWYAIGAFAQLTTNQITNAAALWITLPVSGTAVISNGYTGAATSQTASRLTGLPLLDNRVKVTFTYGGGMTTNNGVYVDVKANTTGKAMRDAILLNTITESTVTTTAQNVTTTFNIPRDVSNIVMKQYGTGMGASTCNIYLQTTDDGGTTWYDVASPAQFATSTITSANALWLNVPVDGTSTTRGGYGYTGACTSASLTAATVSGLPILSRECRLYFKYAGANTSNPGIVVKIYGSMSQIAGG